MLTKTELSARDNEESDYVQLTCCGANTMIPYHTVIWRYAPYLPSFGGIYS